MCPLSMLGRPFVLHQESKEITVFMCRCLQQRRVRANKYHLGTSCRCKVDTYNNGRLFVISISTSKKIHCLVTFFCVLSGRKRDNNIDGPWIWYGDRSCSRHAP